MAPSIELSGAQVIDASNTIVIPGFVDAHRHSWEGQLRRINPNASTLAAYSAELTSSFCQEVTVRRTCTSAILFTGAWHASNAGITCVIDNAYNARSARHSDEAILVLLDSGIPSRCTPRAPQAGDWEHQLACRTSNGSRNSILPRTDVAESPCAMFSGSRPVTIARLPDGSACVLPRSSTELRAAEAVEAVLRR